MHQLDGGPEVLVETSSQAMWYDPDDPNPDPIWFEEDEVTPIFERDTDADQAIANRTYAKPDPDEGEDDSPESLGIIKKPLTSPCLEPLS